MRTLILNSSNILPNTNNSVFYYKFPAGAVVLTKGQKLALSNLQMYYSNFNITSTYNNNKFSYTWIDGTTVNILIPDSFLDVAGINQYLRFIMVQNKHYYVNATGDFVYLITFSINPSFYAVEVNCFETSLTIATNNGWLIPAGATWVNPNNTIVPILNVVENFNKLIGFDVGSYPNAVISGIPPNQIETPAYTSTQVFLSTIAPEITPVSSFVLTCSLINNNYAIPTNLLYSFSPIGSFGEQFSISPNQYMFIDVQNGQYSGFNCQFLDQNLNPVSLQDPTITILLCISDEGEKINI